MADLLKIKKGLFANLPTTKAPGTIYVVTDEKTMYVDVDATENGRIRVGGNLVMVNTLEELQPPYSKDVIYFVEKYSKNGEDIYVNALLRWNATSKAFVHLNKATDLTSISGQVSQLRTEVDSNTKNIASNASAIKEVSDSLSAHKTEVANYGSRITAVEKKASDNATDIANLKTTAADLRTDVDGNKNNIASLTTTVSDNKTAIETALATETNERKTADEAINKSLGAAGDPANAAGSAYARIAALVTKDNDQQTLIEGNTANISKNTGDIAGLNSRVTTAEKEIDALQAAVGNAENIATRLSAVESVASGAQTAAANAQSAADKAQGTVDALTETVNTNATTAATDRDKIRDEFAAADDALNTKISGVDNRLKTAETTISNHTTKLDDLNTKINSDIASAKTELKADIKQSINAANAMNYKGNITKYADLPTTNVSVGDTYVFANDVLSDSGELLYSAGDMMIAKGEEDLAGTGFITSGLAWDRVQTGYQVDQDPSLEGEGDKITLKNFLGKSLGSISFAQPTEADGGIKATVTGETITLEVVWGSF